MAVAVRREGGGRALGSRRATTVCMAVAPTPVAVAVAPVAVAVAVAPEDEQPNEVDAQTHSTYDQQLIQVLPQVVLDLSQVCESVQCVQRDDETHRQQEDGVDEGPDDLHAAVPVRDLCTGLFFGQASGHEANEQRR